MEKLDVSDFQSIDNFINVIKDKYGKIHVLVNNAGVAAKGDAFDADIIRWTFQTVKYLLFRISMGLSISLKRYYLIL